MLNLCLQNVNTSEGKLTVVHNELVHIHGSSPRTTKELDHYLWKAGSHIHHSCLSKRHKKQTFKKWSWVKFSSSGATKRFYYSSHKSHKPAASLFPLKCALYRVHTAWKLLSQKMHVFVLFRCFLWIVAHSGQTSPTVVQSMRKCVCLWVWEICYHTQSWKRLE